MGRGGDETVPLPSRVESAVYKAGQSKRRGHCCGRQDRAGPPTPGAVDVRHRQQCSQGLGRGRGGGAVHILRLAAAGSGKQIMQGAEELRNQRGVVSTSMRGSPFCKQPGATRHRHPRPPIRRGLTHPSAASSGCRRAGTSSGATSNSTYSASRKTEGQMGGRACGSLDGGRGIAGTGGEARWRVDDSEDLGAWVAC